MTGASPLHGVKVVDFTHILAGPFCTQLLADAGADVVKVEPPTGEFARIRGFMRVAPDGTQTSSYHSAINRGKRSIALDLKNPGGLEVALALVASADVVVENFAPGALTRLGLDFTKLRAADPRLITASISLFGGAGSGRARSARGGLAIVAEGESSVTSMVRDAQGTPVKLGFPLGDMSTGMAAAGAITTALYARERTGEGQHLDVSMVGTLLALNSSDITGAQIPGWNPTTSTTAYGIYPASDGFVTIGVSTNSLFQRLCQAMDQPDLAVDPRFADLRDRVQNSQAGDAIVREWTSARTCDDIIAVLGPTGVPCGRVATPTDVLADDELRDMGFFEVTDDGSGGTFDTPRNPMGFRPERTSLPGLAEHAATILAEVGIGAAPAAELAAAGAFGRIS